MDPYAGITHRAPTRPLHFPVEEQVPESVIHLCVREFLHLLLRFTLSGRAFVGSDQFVYFDGANPRRCVAPDVYVKWGDGGPRPITSWKVWQRGTPELCIEIDSPGDESAWPTKLEHYQSMGVQELVRFHSEAPDGERLQVWDRIDDVLVERVVLNDATPCIALGLHWVVRPIEDAPAGLRLAEDAAGARLLPTEIEAERERAARERAEAANERTRADEAMRRIAELEAELRRRGS